MDIVLRESLISKETCESFIGLFNKDLAIDGTYKNSDVYPGKRNTKVCGVDADSLIGFLLFNQILLANQKSNWLFDIDFIVSVQINEYSIGGFYDWHSDQVAHDRDGSGTQRKISLTLLLSDPDTYEGGDLIFEGSDQPPTRKQGSIIIFPSFIKHTVTPVTSGVRYSAVVWAKGPYFK